MTIKGGILSVVAISIVLLLAGAITYFVVGSKPAPAVVTQSAKGFWKNIDVDEGSAPAFFCNDTGAYQGHVVNSENGWWVAMKSDKKLDSYASEAFAKKRIEEDAECK